ncbi:hypothetical protein FE257_000089 [Aspergillus nanangensis]|uniref:Uncharacterized protein n=1 Tax=Aspergillus nanangensis TaxID=2582783 RepID=A0AAD4D0Q5_ASPNN|nr:hypothetical protein FE257_000089 [Aspergillus nanangensis]
MPCLGLAPQCLPLCFPVSRAEPVGAIQKLSVLETLWHIDPEASSDDQKFSTELYDGAPPVVGVAQRWLEIDGR